MGSGKQYRSRVEVSTSSEMDSEGARVIKAVIRGERKLFDATALLEEKGGLMPLQARIERAIKDEVVASLREVDEFFRLVRSKAPRPKKRRSASDSSGESRNSEG
jgi:hypothetical protein